MRPCCSIVYKCLNSSWNLKAKWNVLVYWIRITRNIYMPMLISETRSPVGVLMNTCLYIYVLVYFLYHLSLVTLFYFFIYLLIFIIIRKQFGGGGLTYYRSQIKKKLLICKACSYYKGGVWERFFRAQDKSLTCRNERRNTSVNNVHVFVWDINISQKRFHT